MIKILLKSVCILICANTICLGAMPLISMKPKACPPDQPDHSWIAHPEDWAFCAEKSSELMVSEGVILDRVGVPKVDVNVLIETAKKTNQTIAIEFSLFGHNKALEDKINQGARAGKLVIEKLLKPIYQAGGEVGVLYLDGPDYRLLKGLHKFSENALNLEEYAQAMILFYQTIHKFDPMIKIGFIIDPKAWDFDKDTIGCHNVYTRKSGIFLEDNLNALYDAFAKSDEKIDFLCTDCPYWYYTQKQNLRDKRPVSQKENFLKLQSWCVERKMDFRIIVNDHPKLKGEVDNFTTEQKAESNESYQESCLNYINDLYADGIRPNWIVFNCWYKVPTKNSPETTSYTFFNTTKLCIELLESQYKKLDSE